MNKKKLVVFDMDDTLIRNNMWYDFNVAMGVSSDRDYELYLQFKAGDINYDKWLELLQAEYSHDISKQHVENILTTYQLADGAEEATTAAKQAGLETSIISGSFTVTAIHLGNTLGIDYVRANTVCKFTDSDSNVAQYLID